METVRMSTLELDNETGGIREMDIKVIPMSAIKSCPSFIFLPSHWRTNGTCRHDEPNCEEDGCTNLKADNEIFCVAHLEEM